MSVWNLFDFKLYEIRYHKVRPLDMMGILHHSSKYILLQFYHLRIHVPSSNNKVSIYIVFVL